MAADTRLDAAACIAVDSTGQFAETLDLGSHLEDALWRVDSAGIEPRRARRRDRGRDGRLLGRRPARRPRSRPAPAAPAGDRHGLRDPGVDRARDARAVLELLRHHGGTIATYDAAERAGAPRIVATTGGALAERARADGVPVVPLPGGFQPRAAVGYSLVTALEAAALCGAAPSVRDDVARPRRSPRTLAGEWGPDGPRGLARPSGWRARSRHVPVSRRRSDGVRGLPLEVPDQRERGAAGLRGQAARARPPRDRRLGRGGGAARRRLPRGPRGDERAARRLEVTAEIAATAPPSWSASRAQGFAPRAAGLARPARRPRLAVPRGAPRRRSRAVAAIDALKERLRACRLTASALI